MRDILFKPVACAIALLLNMVGMNRKGRYNEIREMMENEHYPR